MDYSAHSASVFHKLADRYREEYMDLTLYDDSYRDFCEMLPPGSARVLDVACGPGNVSRFLISQRGDLDLLGIDLAPRMVDLAREAVPSARFAVHDCRKLADLKLRFDGIICAFGLPYLSWPEAASFIRAAYDSLEPAGALYLSALLGRPEESGFEPCSTGDQVYVNYHSEDQIIGALRDCAFTIVSQRQLPSPSAAPKPTTDLVVIAKK
jgi:SAM-dependent methyltransferase